MTAVISAFGGIHKSVPSLMIGGVAAHFFSNSRFSQSGSPQSTRIPLSTANLTPFQFLCAVEPRYSHQVVTAYC
jgi:hypothetical protein